MVFSGIDNLAVSWNFGNSNLVISVPHAGTLGADQTPNGNLKCPSGNLVESRKGTLEHPLKHYGRDTGTDVIASRIESILDEEGMRPHVITCHIHRNKVEVNRDISKKAVQHRGGEAEYIYTTYHRWISQALQISRDSSAIHASLLIDLHGHGHPHNYIELGYRIPGLMLNEIEKASTGKQSRQTYTLALLEDLKYFSIPESILERDSENFEENLKTRSWRTIVTSPVKHEFTLNSLISRKFGTSNDSLKESLIGQDSFAGCLSKHLERCSLLKDIQCIPSLAKPSPARLGYYIGGYTVLKHAKWKGVDAIQIELPTAVRTRPGEMRDAMIVALSSGIKDFHNKHYHANNTEERVLDAKKGDDAQLDKMSVVRVPLCQVKWSWKGKRLMRTN